MDCCQSLAKYLLMLFNVFVWVAGGSLLGIGIYLRVGGCYIMIFAGALMFGIGFVGCCGAMTEGRCLLGTYFTALLLLFFLEVGLGIWAAVQHDQIDDAIRKGFNKTLSGGDDPNDAMAQSAIAIQRQFHCCGLLNGCTDWAGSKSYGCTCNKGEANCTLASSLGCTVGDKDGGEYIWKDDCYDSVVDYVEDNVWLIVGIGIGIGCAEIIGMILSLSVCCWSKQGRYEGMYA